MCVRNMGEELSYAQARARSGMRVSLSVVLGGHLSGVQGAPQFLTASKHHVIPNTTLDFNSGVAGHDRCTCTCSILNNVNENGLFYKICTCTLILQLLYIHN